MVRAYLLLLLALSHAAAPATRGSVYLCVCATGDYCFQDRPTTCMCCAQVACVGGCSNHACHECSHDTKPTGGGHGSPCQYFLLSDGLRHPAIAPPKSVADFADIALVPATCIDALSSVLTHLPSDHGLPSDDPGAFFLTVISTVVIRC